MDILLGDLFSRDLEHRRKSWVTDMDWGTLPRENIDFRQYNIEL